MKYKYIYYLFVGAWLLFACSSGEEKKEEKKYLSSQILNLVSSSSIECYEKILILPGTGCSGCISKTEDFFIKNYKNTEYLFLLTNITSVKIMNHKVNDDLTQIRNVYLDFENVFSNYESAIYPVSIVFDCNKLETKKIDFLGPDQNFLK